MNVTRYLLAGHIIHEMELVRNHIAVIIQVQHKALIVYERAFDIALFHVLMEAFYGSPLGLIIVAYRALLRGGLVLSISFAFDILRPVYYRYRRMDIVLGIPEYYLVGCAFAGGEYKALLVFIYRIALNRLKYLGNYGLSRFHGLRVMQLRLRTYLKVFYDVSDLISRSINKCKLVSLIVFHLYGMAGHIGEVTSRVGCVQRITNLGFECLCLKHERAANGIVSNLRSVSKLIMDDIVYQNISPPLGVEVHVVLNRHGQVKRMLHAVCILIEPAYERITAVSCGVVLSKFIVVDLLSLFDLCTFGLSKSHGMNHRRPLGIDNRIFIRHFGSLPINSVGAAGVGIPTIELISARFKLLRIVRSEVITRQRLFVRNSLALYNNVGIVEVQLIAVAGVVNSIAITILLPILIGKSRNINKVLLSHIAICSGHSKRIF